jgi:hypothetical protein
MSGQLRLLAMHRTSESCSYLASLHDTAPYSGQPHLGLGRRCMSGGLSVALLAPAEHRYNNVRNCLQQQHSLYYGALLRGVIPYTQQATQAWKGFSILCPRACLLPCRWSQPRLFWDSFIRFSRESGHSPDFLSCRLKARARRRVGCIMDARPLQKAFSRYCVLQDAFLLQLLLTLQPVVRAIPSHHRDRSENRVAKSVRR